MGWDSKKYAFHAQSAHLPLSVHGSELGQRSWHGRPMYRAAIPDRATEISVVQSSGRFWGVVLYSVDTGESFCSLGVKRPGRDAHHSPPSTAEVMNE